MDIYYVFDSDNNVLLFAHKENIDLSALVFKEGKMSRFIRIIGIHKQEFDYFKAKITTKGCYFDNNVPCYILRSADVLGKEIQYLTPIKPFMLDLYQQYQTNVEKHLKAELERKWKKDKQLQYLIEMEYAENKWLYTSMRNVQMIHTGEVKKSRKRKRHRKNKDKKVLATTPDNYNLLQLMQKKMLD